MQDNRPAGLTVALKQYALSLGAPRLGVALAGPVAPRHVYEGWLELGRHAGMDYLRQRLPERTDPRKLLPGARSVVALAVPYHHPRPQPPDDPTRGKVSCYAWGRDYHRVVSAILRRLRAFILERAPKANVYAEVDTGPVLERYWGERAGIGWIGKNGCLIAPQLGSWVFLGILVTDLELDYGLPAERNCDDCTRCIEACPTGAILEPGLVDARKCISYWTVEHRGEFPDRPKPDLHGWVFGCDICQEVCPWNREPPVSPVEDFAPRPGIADPDLLWLACLSPDDYQQRFRGSAMRRAGLAGLRRNARGVMTSRRLQPPG